MRSFYLRFRVYAIQKWPLLWNLSSDLQSPLVFLYANSLYASLFFESLSLAYNEVHLYYRAVHRFWQAKFPYGGLILGSSRFSILPQLPLKILLDSKVVKIDPKIVISLHKSKSVTHSVDRMEFLHFIYFIYVSLMFIEFFLFKLSTCTPDSIF